MSDEYFVAIFQLAFTCAVYPCLILAYMGQAAFLSRNNGDIERSFYMSIPSNSLSISIYLLYEFNLKNGQGVSIIWYLLLQKHICGVCRCISINHDFFLRMVFAYAFLLIHIFMNCLYICISVHSLFVYVEDCLCISI